MKKTIIYFFIACLIGIIISRYIFNEYSKGAYAKEKNNYIYMFQTSAYKDKDIMMENSKILKNYLYYKEDNIYHVIIGISLDKNNENKIKSAYNLDNIYTFKKEINNNEFLITLKEYEKLLSVTNDNDSILNIEKQILANYKEIFLDE